MDNLTIHNLSNTHLSSYNAKSLANIFLAYAEDCPRETIFEIGFNSNTGYIYIALEMNNIQICSRYGGGVQYLLTNCDTGSEEFFETYQEAVNSIF